MMPLPTTFESSDLVLQLLPQALKILGNDFRTSGLDWDSDLERIVTLKDTRDRLAMWLSRHAKTGSEKFYRLLYRVDLPENRVHRALQEQTDRNGDELISEMLIIRALQKAYFRANFGSKTDLE
ncbi:MAG: hypothetical protein LW750_06225 [Bacteroidetes bacterium]|jgi:hypothetical protein|nr:hypothetical protein [Bacteroidota bacterium]